MISWMRGTSLMVAGRIISCFFFLLDSSVGHRIISQYAGRKRGFAPGQRPLRDCGPGAENVNADRRPLRDFPAERAERDRHLQGRMVVTVPPGGGGDPG